ncbi:DUF2156 domain-containing protein [Desulfobacterium sp. N47]|uniref:Phosphatidylglycerol lysyltransferase C-terminal domain-containing protein n=1 Tax=uncultured Desulfobacterium sp. TaxID=201089 RepID=E1YLL2_9BACT|nr:hypothetical protein N47_E45070 [uncultured Desulfobacterium sp.]
MSLLFKPVSIEIQNDYLRFFHKCSQKASDYSFVNIWGWADEYGIELARDKNLIWIRQTRPEIVYWAPVGDWENADWEKIIETDITGYSVFIRVPETLANIWKNCAIRHMDIKEARGHWDYLYSVKDLVELKGNRFHKKKNLFSQFIKSYNHEYIPLTPDIIEQAVSMQADWCTWRDCEATETLSSENRVIEKILKVWEKLYGLKGGALKVDGKFVAYTVAESIADDTLLIHFEKANQEYKGAYQAINRVFLEKNGKGYEKVNREQDLDDESLRKAKLSYNPLDYIKKYRVVIS